MIRKMGIMKCNIDGVKLYSLSPVQIAFSLAENGMMEFGAKLLAEDVGKAIARKLKP